MTELIERMKKSYELLISSLDAQVESLNNLVKGQRELIEEQNTHIDKLKIEVLYQRFKTALKREKANGLEN